MAAYSTKTSNTSVYCPDCRNLIHWAHRCTSSQAIAQHKEEGKCNGSLITEDARKSEGRECKMPWWAGGGVGTSDQSIMELKDAITKLTWANREYMRHNNVLQDKLEQSWDRNQELKDRVDYLERTMNLVEGLSREIERVSQMKQDATQMIGQPGVNMGFYIAACAQAIETGHKAIGSDDILRMKPAYEALVEIH